jgi:hypothetical protein
MEITSRAWQPAITSLVESELDHAGATTHRSQKMINLRPITLSFVLLVPNIAGAQSTSLEPAEGYFSSYDFSHAYSTKVRNILLKGITDTPDAMLVTLASFSPESAIVLTEGEVIMLRCSKPIWHNDVPEKIQVEKTSIRISKELATAIHTLWFDALGTTSYPDESRAGLDGASFYFTSFREGLGLRAGTAWCPEAKSLPSELLKVANGLRNLDGKGEAYKKELLDRVQTLDAKIKKREQAGTGQPATRPVVEPEGGDNPKPEAEGRSR